MVRAGRSMVLAAAILSLLGCSKAVQSDACSGGELMCGTTCTDLGTTQDCGECGNACSADAGAICDGGSCWLGCPTGTVACPPDNPTTCADLGTDNANCGACSRACAQGLTCTRGICFCPPGDICT